VVQIKDMTIGKRQWFALMLCLQENLNGNNSSNTSNSDFTAQIINIPKFEMNSNYEIISTVGKGEHGHVKKALRLSDSRPVIIKMIKKDMISPDAWVDDQVYGRVPFEISITRRLEHENIVKLLDAFESEYYFYMVQEMHGDGMDLFELIDKYRGLNELTGRYLFTQLLNAIAFCHHNCICHRDIKDESPSFPVRM